MAERISYVRFDDNERRVLEDAASLIAGGGDESAALINSVTRSTEPISGDRLARLSAAVSATILRQEEAIRVTADAGHSVLGPTYRQNINERLIPASAVVYDALELLDET